MVVRKVVAPLLGYLDRIEKILTGQAYNKTFMKWVEDNIAGLKVEIPLVPPSSKGFVLLFCYKQLYIKCKCYIYRKLINFYNHNLPFYG